MTLKSDQGPWIFFHSCQKSLPQQISWNLFFTLEKGRWNRIRMFFQKRQFQTRGSKQDIAAPTVCGSGEQCAAGLPPRRGPPAPVCLLSGVKHYLFPLKTQPISNMDSDSLANSTEEGECNSFSTCLPGKGHLNCQSSSQPFAVGRSSWGVYLKGTISQSSSLGLWGTQVPAASLASLGSW